MESIKTVVGKIMQNYKQKKSDDFFICNFLNKLLTKEELKHIKISYYKKGILSIIVDSSAWLYQLSLKEKDLLLQLKDKLTDIKKLSFRIGEIKRDN